VGSFFLWNEYLYNVISPATIKKVHETADLLDVVGSFVKLKKRGSNYLGNCPFHNEKTPSFTVSPSKGIYKCFGCGKAGNVITFVQEHEKLTYPETIVWLAKRYHIEVEETTQSDEVRELRHTEESLRIINQFAVRYFHEALLQTEEGQIAGLSYFHERDFRTETIEQFQLGYCPEDKTLFPARALEQGYDRELLLKAGLVYERNGQLYAMYGGRVIFPIHSQSGKIIGFGARILKQNEKAPKYINTPENEIYHKSQTLYGIYFARTPITQQNECYLVEGYTDVISLHQSGIGNAVASSGTSLTEEQLRLIKRYTKNLTILYDGDAAGIKAALRGMDMAIEQGLNVQVVLLPDNHDPDSYVKQIGMQAFHEYVQKNRKDIILFRLETSLLEAKEDSVRKSELINDIAETLSRINKVEEFTRQQDYVRRCAQLLQIEEAGLISLINKKIREKLVKREGIDRREADELERQAAPETTHNPEGAESLLKQDYLQERALIRVLLEQGNKPYDEQNSVAEYIRIKVNADEFENKEWSTIFTLYYTELDRTLQFPEASVFTYHSDESVRTAAIEALYFPYEISPGWFEKHQIAVPSRELLYVQDVNDTVCFFLLRKLKLVIRNLFSELEKLNDQDVEQVQQLLYSLRSLKEAEAELMSPMKTVLAR